jgi:fatty acid desaturase
MLAAFGVAQALLMWTAAQGFVWLTGCLSVLLAHLMHSQLVAFHEAAHGSLCPQRAVNDVIGTCIGILSFVPFSLYRATHHYHHAFLASERDEELWPFVIPTCPHCARLVAAAAELSFGVIYAPLLFLRAFLRKGSPIVNRRVRRRICAEYSLSALVFGTGIGIVAWFEMWQSVLIFYLLPAWLAGNLQSWRKYIEHVGMTGSTPLGSTRSIVPQSWLGKVVAATLFNEPYHAVHHKYARLPQHALPAFAGMLADAQPQPYASYLHALPAMLRSLRDPRVGKQWANRGAARFQ